MHLILCLDKIFKKEAFKHWKIASDQTEDILRFIHKLLISLGILVSQYSEPHACGIDLSQITSENYDENCGVSQQELIIAKGLYNLVGFFFFASVFLSFNTPDFLFKRR